MPRYELNLVYHLANTLDSIIIIIIIISIISIIIIINIIIIHYIIGSLIKHIKGKRKRLLALTSIAM